MLSSQSPSTAFSSAPQLGPDEERLWYSAFGEFEEEWSEWDVVCCGHAATPTQTESQDGLSDSRDSDDEPCAPSLATSENGPTRVAAQKRKRNTVEADSDRA